MALLCTTSNGPRRNECDKRRRNLTLAINCDNSRDTRRLDSAAAVQQVSPVYWWTNCSVSRSRCCLSPLLLLLLLHPMPCCSNRRSRYANHYAGAAAQQFDASLNNSASSLICSLESRQILTPRSVSSSSSMNIRKQANDHFRIFVRKSRWRFCMSVFTLSAQLTTHSSRYSY